MFWLTDLADIVSGRQSSAFSPFLQTLISSGRATMIASPSALPWTKHAIRRLAAPLRPEQTEEGRPFTTTQIEQRARRHHDGVCISGWLVALVYLICLRKGSLFSMRTRLTNNYIRHGCAVMHVHASLQAFLIEGHHGRLCPDLVDPSEQPPNLLRTSFAHICTSVHTY